MADPMPRRRRKILTDRMVAALPRQNKRTILADPEQRGHYVRIPPSGPCVFAAVARYKGKQTWATLGSTAEIRIDEARDKARKVIGRIKQGLPAFEPGPVAPDSLAAVAENWLARHIEAKGLRTGDELKRVLEKYILPVWHDRVFVEIRRSDIARLLDAIEDTNGHWVADKVLAVLRALASWYATRHDDYVPPFTKNMLRTPAQLRQRSRILDDDELKRVWNAAEGAGVFGAFVMLLLLTGQRREKVVTMKWADLDGDLWTIASAPREKGNPGVLRLPSLAMTIIARQPRMASNPFVFAGRSTGPMSSYSNRHTAFKALCGVDGWTLHDLRRTARSLLSRTSVRPDIAERVLGHAVGGVAGIYDRHHYRNEIADALKQLARLITHIVDGENSNVVPFVAG